MLATLPPKRKHHVRGTCHAMIPFQGNSCICAMHLSHGGCLPWQSEKRRDVTNLAILEFFSDFGDLGDLEYVGTALKGTLRYFATS